MYFHFIKYRKHVQITMLSLFISHQFASLGELVSVF